MLFNGLGRCKWFNLKRKHNAQKFNKFWMISSNSPTRFRDIFWKICRRKECKLKFLRKLLLAMHKKSFNMIFPFIVGVAVVVVVIWLFGNPETPKIMKSALSFQTIIEIYNFCFFFHFEFNFLQSSFKLNKFKCVSIYEMK